MNHWIYLKCKDGQKKNQCSGWLVITENSRELKAFGGNQSILCSIQPDSPIIYIMIDLNSLGVPTSETNYVIFTTLVGLVCKYIAVILNDATQKMQSFSCMHSNDYMPLDKGSLSEFCQASFEWVVYFEKGIFNEELVKIAKSVNYDYIK